MEQVREPFVEGRVWKFGDHMNTDLIFPGFAMSAPVEEQPKYVFSANRPGWADMVRAGDIIVAGQNFGLGSGRPIGQVLARLGIVAVLAESFNGLGLRNCINAGVMAQPFESVTEMFDEGDIARCRWASGSIENVTNGRTARVAPLPGALRDIAAAGGVLAVLREQGFIREAPDEAPIVVGRA